MPHTKKKILIISPYFYPNVEWGGPVTVVWNLARELKKAGNNVEVLTTDISKNGRNPSVETKIVDGVKITYAKSILPTLAWKFRIFISIDQIVKAWKMIPLFDIVHFQDIFIARYGILSLICRYFKIPYVITAHGNLNFKKERSKSLLKKIYYAFLIKGFLHNANKIIAVSEIEKKEIVKNFPALLSKTVVVPNIVAKDDYKKIDIRTKFNIPKNNLIVLFAGRIYALKGVNELVLGFAEFIRKNIDSTLILAGPDAGGLSEIEKIISKNPALKNSVVITGEVTGDLKQSLFACCDIFVLLSKSESLPTTILEAAIFGKPVVFTDECNVKDLAYDGGGILTKRDKEDVSSSLKKLSNKDFREKMGDKAKKWFLKNYNSSTAINLIEGIYEDAK